MHLQQLIKISAACSSVVPNCMLHATKAKMPPSLLMQGNGSSIKINSGTQPNRWRDICFRWWIGVVNMCLSWATSVFWPFGHPNHTHTHTSLKCRFTFDNSILSPARPLLVIALDVSLFLSREVHAHRSTSRVGTVPGYKIPFCLPPTNHHRIIPWWMSSPAVSSARPLGRMTALTPPSGVWSSEPLDV